VKWGLVLVALTGSARAQISVPCADSQTQERIRTLLLEGIDQALRNQTVRAFDFWMKDQTAQPKRALIGMDMAVSAFIRSRQNAMQWMPPLCGEKP